MKVQSRLHGDKSNEEVVYIRTVKGQEKQKGNRQKQKKQHKKRLVVAAEQTEAEEAKTNHDQLQRNNKKKKGQKRKRPTSNGDLKKTAQYLNVESSRLEKNQDSSKVIKKMKANDYTKRDKKKRKKKKKKKSSPCQNLKPRLSKEEIQEKELLQYTGIIRVLESTDEVEKVIKSIMTLNNESKTQKYIGFDTETKPVFRKGVKHPTALVQLATDDAVYIIRLCKNRDLFRYLLPLLQSESYIKLGVSVQQDVKELQESFPTTAFKPKGFLDLTSITMIQLKYPEAGLRGLVARFLNCRISKGQSTSNWAAPLNKAQLFYAATDAWVGREIYFAAMIKLNKNVVEV